MTVLRVVIVTTLTLAGFARAQPRPVAGSVYTTEQAEPRCRTLRRAMRLVPRRTQTANT